MILALDTESTYSKDRDIRSLGVHNYVNHSETHHYLAAIYGENLAWVGKPAEIPWSTLGEFPVVIAHNRAYDESVMTRIDPVSCTAAEWHCSADLAAYHQSPRSLAGAAEHLLGVKLDKSPRDFMKDRAWTGLPDEIRNKIAEYCLVDAKASFWLWQKYSADWPRQEVAASDHTAMMCRRGIGVDLARVTEYLAVLHQSRFAAEQEIPWAGELDAKGKDLPITSPKELALHCRKLGIPPPESTNAASESFDAWAEANEEHVPFVAAVQRWRRSNRLLQLLTAMTTRQHDGILPYSLKYFGASHTGRWSGDAGMNMQNFPRKPVEGVDARSCLVPRPGHKFIVSDFSQIEARVALWLAQDKKMLALLRDGTDLYEAHARVTMGYLDPRPLKDVDPGKRQLAKIRVLALGYGLGSGKFARIAKQWAGIELSEGDAKQQVSDFRRANRPITTLWKQLEDTLKASRGGTMTLELPSGRSIRYFDVGEGSGRVERGEAPKNLYGGKLFENLVSATARDLLALAILRVENAGLPVRLHVHDEIVVEAPEAEATEAARAVQELMEEPPDWAEGLPIAAETVVRDRYGK